VSAYVGSSKNLKDLKVLRAVKPVLGPWRVPSLLRAGKAALRDWYGGPGALKDVLWAYEGCT
jgi:hypothetical protein